MQSWTQRALCRLRSITVREVARDPYFDAVLAALVHFPDVTDVHISPSGAWRASDADAWASVHDAPAARAAAPVAAAAAEVDSDDDSASPAAPPPQAAAMAVVDLLDSTDDEEGGESGGEAGSTDSVAQGPAKRQRAR